MLFKIYSFIIFSLVCLYVFLDLYFHYIHIYLLVYFCFFMLIRQAVLLQSKAILVPVVWLMGWICSTGALPVANCDVWLVFFYQSTEPQI